MTAHEQPPPPTGRSFTLPQLTAALRSGTHAVRATSLPDDPIEAARELNADADLIARFEAAATANGCHCQVIDEAGWLSVALDLLAKHNVRRCLIDVAPDGPLDAKTVATELQSHGLRPSFAGSDTDDIFEMDAGLTDVIAAIAETGSIVCGSGPGRARGSSLIPPVHVAVVRAAQLLPDVVDYFALLDDLPSLPTNLNLITGPSKTADIEGQLVTGIHGPGALHILVIR